MLGYSNARWTFKYSSELIFLDIIILREQSPDGVLGPQGQKVTEQYYIVHKMCVGWSISYTGIINIVMAEFIILCSF